MLVQVELLVTLEEVAKGATKVCLETCWQALQAQLQHQPLMSHAKSAHSIHACWDHRTRHLVQKAVVEGFKPCVLLCIQHSREGAA